MFRVRAGYGLSVALLCVTLSSAAQTRERAVITLTGSAAESAELRGVLRELLERDAIDVRFSEQARFGSAELLRQSSSDEGVEAFVVPGAADRVRLYFRAPDGQRFLVRDVTLPSGLDAVGRELIAQIVDASVAALLRSEAGITRAQAKAALEAAPVDTGETAPASAVARTAAPPVRTPNPKIKASSPKPASKHGTLAADGWLGLRYAADWSGSALGARHGPGLELGIGLRKSAFIRTRVLLERDFPVTLQAGPIDARVSTLRWRALVDGGFPVGQNSALALSIGAGEDRSQIEPTRSRDPSVLPAQSFSEAPFVLHSEARFEAAMSAFELVVAAGFDMPLVRTPYDVDRGSAAKQLAAPWNVRPGAALTVAWRPQLGIF